jgi:hypothetical protein
MRPIKIKRTYLILHTYKDKTTKIEKQDKQKSKIQTKSKDKKTQMRKIVSNYKVSSAFGSIFKSLL